MILNVYKSTLFFLESEIFFLFPWALLFGMLLIQSSQFDSLWCDCQGFSAIYAICLAKVFLPCSFSGNFALVRDTTDWAVFLHL